MTDLAALADEMPPREVADRLEYLSRAYDTFAASGDYVGMGDYGTAIKAIVRTNLSAILAALRASRPEPTADAVEAVARALCEKSLHPRVCPCKGREFRCDDEHPGVMARAALSALPRPEADEGAVPFPATFEEFTNKLRRWCELAEKGQLSWPAAGREIVRDADTLRAALAAAQEGQR